MATAQTPQKKSNTPKKVDKQRMSDAEYMKLGKLVAEMYDKVRPTRNQLYVSSLIKGFLIGFGGVLGATIGISILLYILSALETIPFIEDISKTLQSTIQSDTTTNP